MASLYNTWLTKELEESLTQVDIQIDQFKEEATKMGISVAQLRTPHGDWVMIPLLSARVSILAALTYLQDVKNVGG